jgi:hypothetical protein
MLLSNKEIKSIINKGLRSRKIGEKGSRVGAAV